MKSVSLLILVLLLGATFSWADVVTFKDGRVFEGEVVEEGQSVWVDGIQFNRKEIAGIKKKAFFKKKVKAHTPQKQPWYRRVFKPSFKSAQERARERELEQIRERREKTDEALQASKERRSKEKELVQKKAEKDKAVSSRKTAQKPPPYKGSPSGRY